MKAINLSNLLMRIQVWILINLWKNQLARVFTFLKYVFLCGGYVMHVMFVQSGRFANDWSAAIDKKCCGFNLLTNRVYIYKESEMHSAW